MEKELHYIADLLRRTFEKNAWHGPSVLQVLEGINETQSLQRLPHTHSIRELVAHMTAWREFVVRKLQGDSEYTVSDEANFPQPEWAQALAALKSSQEKLLAQLEAFDVGELHVVVPHGNYTYTFYALLHGIIHHDLYHTGQIALIKKQTL